MDKNKEYNINKETEKNNVNKNLTSSQKLIQKIKDLESKLDDLNSKPTSIYNMTELEENKYNKYSILDEPGLSETTKEYLSSNLDELVPNKELSDFSKAYIMGLDAYNMIINERPSLSGLTKDYLKENDEEIDDNKNEIISEIEEEENA